MERQTWGKTMNLKRLEQIPKGRLFKKLLHKGVDDALVFDKYCYLTVFVRFKGYFFAVNGYQVKIVFFVLFIHLFSFRPQS